MTTLIDTAIGSTYTGSRYEDGLALLLRSTSSTTPSVHVPVAVGSASADEAQDKNVLALGGVLPMDPGDAAYLMFASSATVGTPTFLVTRWKPIRGTAGTIIGYQEFQCHDIGAALTAGTQTLGTVITSVANWDGTTPASPPLTGDLWYKGITCNVDAVAVGVDVIRNNIDLLKVTDDTPCILRITPMDGDSHIRVQTKAATGAGAILTFAYRGRGLGLNKF